MYTQKKHHEIQNISRLDNKPTLGQWMPMPLLNNSDVRRKTNNTINIKTTSNCCTEKNQSTNYCQKKKYSRNTPI